jgi:hypothetical protein
MPRPKPNQTKDEYISYCMAYVKEHEPKAKNWSRGRLYKHCEGLWEKYKSTNASELNTSELTETNNILIPLAFSSDDFESFSSNSSGYEINFTDKGRYETVDAVIAMGDMFYGNVFVSSDVLRESVQQWENTYHDLSHLGTMYPAGFSYTENLDYIVGYNSDARFDETIRGIRLKFNINKNSPKYQTWKAFVETSMDAGRIPNVSIYGFASLKVINANELPEGVRVPETAINDGKVVAISSITPVAVTTCLRGKCNDSAGCGIKQGMSCESGTCDSVKDSPDGETKETNESEVSKEDKINKENIEKRQYLEKRLKEIKGD